jgi:Bacteriophage Mu Gam like protein
MTTETEAPFTVHDERSAAWATDKVLSARARLERVKAACAEAIREAQSEVENTELLFLPMLEAWAAGNLPRGKKSIKLTTGAIGFRTVPGGPRVIDEAAVLAWAKEHGIPGVIKVTESVSRTAVKEYVQATGDQPDGVEVVPSRESFDVK